MDFDESGLDDNGLAYSKECPGLPHNEFWPFWAPLLAFKRAKFWAVRRRGERGPAEGGPGESKPTTTTTTTTTTTPTQATKQPRGVSGCSWFQVFRCLGVLVFWGQKKKKKKKNRKKLKSKTKMKRMEKKEEKEKEKEKEKEEYKKK